MRVNAEDPGLSATDFTGSSGQTVAEGTDDLVELASLGADDLAGTFKDRYGEVAR